MLVRGMALHEGTPKQLKRMPAIELVRRLKRYKDAYRTFPYMTSPYVYPVGGFGATLTPAISTILESNGGSCISGCGYNDILRDDDGRACGITTESGEQVQAGCVVAAPECVPSRVNAKYEVRARSPLHRA